MTPSWQQALRAVLETKVPRQLLDRTWEPPAAMGQCATGKMSPLDCGPILGVKIVTKPNLGLLLACAQ